MINTEHALFGILNFGHSELFDICYLEFVILISADPEIRIKHFTKNFL